jgi:hypothetical protein
MKFSVHSTFRDKRGEQLLPHGLEWNLGGDSFMSYVPLPTGLPIDKEADCNEQRCNTNSTGPNIQDTSEVRQSILEAHNRWCFAKDLPFRSVDEIEQLVLPNITSNDSIQSNIQSSESVHYYVKWKEALMSPNLTLLRLQEAIEVIRTDPSALGDQPKAQMWINGMYHGRLEPSTVSDIVEQVQQTPSRLLSVKRQSGHDTILRVERRFRGGLQHKQDIFDHMVDNLYALEDVTMLQNNDKETAIIGTATLPDWILGGDLSSRLYIRVDKLDGSILFLRPLYHDDLNTCDRRFKLTKGVDDMMIAIVREEVNRLCYLATLPLPYTEIINSGNKQHEKGGQQLVGDFSSFTSRESQHRRNQRKFFGL